MLLDAKSRTEEHLRTREKRVDQLMEELVQLQISLEHSNTVSRTFARTFFTHFNSSLITVIPSPLIIVTKMTSFRHSYSKMCASRYFTSDLWNLVIVILNYYVTLVRKGKKWREKCASWWKKIQAWSWKNRSWRVEDSLLMIKDMKRLSLQVNFTLLNHYIHCWAQIIEWLNCPVWIITQLHLWV